MTSRIMERGKGAVMGELVDDFLLASLGEALVARQGPRGSDGGGSINSRSVAQSEPFIALAGELSTDTTASSRRWPAAQSR